MSDRVTYYFRQKVTEGELNDGFDDLELADRNQNVDSAFMGVFSGLAVAQHAGGNLTVDVSAGVAYDKLGERIEVPSTQNVDVSQDDSAVSTVVSGGGNSKIISVFAEFTRAASDPRTDGNSMTVFFQEAESFKFSVRQGSEAPSPTPVGLDNTAILLADITRAFGQTTILTGNIDLTHRREDTFVHGSGTYKVRRGLVKDALADIIDDLNTIDGQISTINTTLTSDGTAISTLTSAEATDAANIATLQTQMTAVQAAEATDAANIATLTSDVATIDTELEVCVYLNSDEDLGTVGIAPGTQSTRLTINVPVGAGFRCRVHGTFTCSAAGAYSPEITFAGTASGVFSNGYFGGTAPGGIGNADTTTIEWVEGVDVGLNGTAGGHVGFYIDLVLHNVTVGGALNFRMFKTTGTSGDVVLKQGTQMDLLLAAGV